jgi:ATP-dependent Clp endopeptidase proteolytic subunit ClpP
MKRYLTVDPKIHCKDKEDLLDLPVVVRVQKFTEESAEKFSEQMSKAHETGQEIIPIIIDSYGGQAYSTLAMIDDIQSATLPVATIVEGKAMSAGAVLFSMGTEGYRFMSPNATLMIHDVSSFSFGKVEELKSDADETERLNTIIFELMAKNCGKPKDYFLKIIHEHGHADWFLTPKEAKKHNLANHLRVPEYHVNVSVSMSFR